MPNNIRETNQINTTEEHLLKEFMMQEELKKLNETLETLLKHSEERAIKVDEMYQLYKSGGMVITILKWTFTLIMALGGAYLLLKQIFSIVIK